MQLMCVLGNLEQNIVHSPVVCDFYCSHFPEGDLVKNSPWNGNNNEPGKERSGS
jgi:hypothetical protein